MNISKFLIKRQDELDVYGITSKFIKEWETDLCILNEIKEKQVAPRHLPKYTEMISDWIRQNNRLKFNNRIVLSIERFSVEPIVISLNQKKFIVELISHSSNLTEPDVKSTEFDWLRSWRMSTRIPIFYLQCSAILLKWKNRTCCRFIGKFSSFHLSTSLEYYIVALSEWAKGRERKLNTQSSILPISVYSSAYSPHTLHLFLRGSLVEEHLQRAFPDRLELAEPS